MIWDIQEPAEGEAVNETVRAEKEERVALRTWFISLSDLRGKERSLLHGDYYSLSSSDTSMAFLRVWDQSERYITAVNWGATEDTLTLKLNSEGKCRGSCYFSRLQSQERFNGPFSIPTEEKLPKTAKVKLSTDKKLEVDSEVELEKLILGAGQAVLLQFPYKV